MIRVFPTSLGTAADTATLLDLGGPHPALGQGLRSRKAMRAALSCSQLALFRPPFTLRRLYIAQDKDPAGHQAAQKLARSALCVGIQPIVLTPTLKDFNDDLRQFGVGALQVALCSRLRAEDVSRFMAIDARQVEAEATLTPDRGDFDTDLRQSGVGALQVALRDRLRLENGGRLTTVEVGKVEAEAGPMPDR
jgi:Toprim domain